MDGQSHPMLGSPQPGVTISHHNSLPMMHHSMKSPLTPPGGPLELTVNSHQRTGMGADGRKYSLGKLFVFVIFFTDLISIVNSSQLWYQT